MIAKLKFLCLEKNHEQVAQLLVGRFKIEVPIFPAFLLKSTFPFRDLKSHYSHWKEHQKLPLEHPTGCQIEFPTASQQLGKLDFLVVRFAQHSLLNFAPPTQF